MLSRAAKAPSERKGFEHGCHKSKENRAGEQLAEDCKEANHAIVGTFAKLTVEKDFELRKAVRGAGGSIAW